MGCGKTFLETPKFGEDVKAQAIAAYFEAEASYRSVARALGVHADTVWTWVQELGARCKTFAEIATELRPTWGGYLLADGRTVRIRGVKHALCLTADVSTQDVPHAVLEAHEDFQAWQRVFLAVKALGYPLKGLILDGDPALWAAARSVFPTAPIQVCVWHVDRQLRHWLRYVYRGPTTRVEAFADLCHRLCYAASPDHAAWLQERWRRGRHVFVRYGLREAVETFEAKMPHLWVHFTHPGMPRTTNVIEGIIRQLGRKLDDTDGFQTLGTAWATIQLLLMRYRFHPFSCSRLRRHNGHSPLALAGVAADRLNWVHFARRPDQPS